MEFHGQEARDIHSRLLRSKEPCKYDVRYGTNKLLFHCDKPNTSIISYKYRNVMGEFVHRYIAILEEIQNYLSDTTYIKLPMPMVDIAQLPESVNGIIQAYLDSEASIKKRRSLRLMEPVTVDGLVKRLKK